MYLLLFILGSVIIIGIAVHIDKSVREKKRQRDTGCSAALGQTCLKLLLRRSKIQVNGIFLSGGTRYQ